MEKIEGAGQIASREKDTRPGRRLIWEEPKLMSLSMPNAEGACANGTAAANKNPANWYCSGGSLAQSCSPTGATAGPGCYNGSSAGRRTPCRSGNVGQAV